MISRWIEKIKMAGFLWLARRAGDCKNITPTLGETLDRRISFRERLLIRIHLFVCDACGRYLSQVQFLHKALGLHEHHLRSGDAEQHITLSPEAKLRIKQSLRSES